MFQLFDLSGRVAVVTGSTKGMGLEMARALGQAGARVVVSGRDAAVSESVAAKLRDADIDATGIACDIASTESVRAFAAQVLEKFGRVDALVLNAAGSGAPSSDVGFAVTSAGGCVGLPLAPTFQAPVVSGNNVSLAWTAPTGGALARGPAARPGADPGAARRESDPARCGVRRPR